MRCHSHSNTHSCVLCGCWFILTLCLFSCGVCVCVSLSLSLSPSRSSVSAQSLLQPETFQFIIRVEGTNVDGKVKIPYALTAIKGVGRRLAFLACKKAEIDPSRRSVFRNLW